MIKTIRFVKTVMIDIETDEIISIVETVESGNSSINIKDQKPKKTVSKIVQTNADFELTNGKFQLSPKAVELLNASVGDRIAVSYGNKDNEFYPIISKSSTFGDSEAGNKLTKALSVSFKGKQYESLKLYGNVFDLVKSDELPENVFRLVDPNASVLGTIKEDELEEVDIMPETVSETKDDLELEILPVNPENFINFGFDFNI